MKLLTLTSLYYHFSVLLLFRPFLRLKLVGSRIIPLEVCCQATDAIQRLVSSYSKLYTLRRTPTFVPYFTFVSVTVHLSIAALLRQLDRSKSPVKSPDVCEALRVGLAHLTEMAPYHSFATQALHTIRYLTHTRNINADIKGNTPPLDYLVKSRGSSTTFSAPNIVIECPLCGTSLEGAIGSEGAGTAARSIEVPLSTLLRLQNKPILPTELDLEQAGFSLL